MVTSKVAVVTGSNRGLGLAIVKGLCLNFDGDVYLTSRNKERGQEAVKKLESEGLKVKYHQLDIDDEKSIICFRDVMIAMYGGIDVLVNNVGIAYKVADTTPFKIQAAITVKTNFFGTLQISQILLPHLKPNGRIVNVSSFRSIGCLQTCGYGLHKLLTSRTLTEEQLAAKMSDFVSAAQDGSYAEKGWSDNSYSVSKMGVTVLTRVHANWLCAQGKKNILINACCPGWVQTDMGGLDAPKTPDEGAVTPLFLALLPAGLNEPQGKFFQNKKEVPW